MAAQVATITISAVNYYVYSFASNAVTDADAYFAGRVGASTWTASTTLQKQQGLITAARWLDSQVWQGTKTVAAQSLAFPRDGLTCNGVSSAVNTIPDGLVYAEYEGALSLLLDASVISSTGSGSNIKSLHAGSASIEYFAPTLLIAGLNTPLPVLMQRLAGCYLAGSVAFASTLIVASGTGDDSLFDDCGRFGLSEGFQ